MFGTTPARFFFRFDVFDMVAGACSPTFLQPGRRIYTDLNTHDRIHGAFVLIFIRHYNDGLGDLPCDMSLFVITSRVNYITRALEAR